MDFAAAIDFVNREGLGTVMESAGILLKLMRLIKSYYQSIRFHIRVRGSETSSFEVHAGGRQGCSLAPAPFNYISDWILRRALQHVLGVQVGSNVSITDLAYPGDIAHVSICHNAITQTHKIKH